MLQFKHDKNSILEQYVQYLRIEKVGENAMKEKKGSVIGLIFKIIFFTLAFIILFISGTIMFKAYAYPDKVPDVLGYKPMIVLSGSMESSINEGDLVFVKIVDTDTLKEDDIIAFRNENNRVTTHRIIEVVDGSEGTFFRTKGDANEAEDDNLVEEEAVEGIYVSKIDGAGNVLMFLKEPIGLIVILLVILVVGLIWLYILNIRDQKEFFKEEEELRKEFEEFKKMKEKEKEQEQEGKNKKKKN